MDLEIAFLILLKAEPGSLASVVLNAVKVSTAGAVSWIRVVLAMLSVRIIGESTAMLRLMVGIQLEAIAATIILWMIRVLHSGGKLVLGIMLPPLLRSGIRQGGVVLSTAMMWIGTRRIIAERQIVVIGHGYLFGRV